MMNKVQMNAEMLEQVNGGYIWETHSLTESYYNKYGVATDFCIFDRDKFYLPGDVEVGEYAANQYVINQIGQDRFDRFVAARTPAARTPASRVNFK